MVEIGCILWDLGYGGAPLNNGGILFFKGSVVYGLLWNNHNVFLASAPYSTDTLHIDY